MPISPYYKMLSEEEFPNPPPLSLGITQTLQKPRASLGMTNVGPNLGVELPDPYAEQEEEPTPFQQNRARIIPSGDDIADPEPTMSPYAPRLFEDDSVVSQDPRFSLGMTKTRQPFNLGVDLNAQGETGETLTKEDQIPPVSASAQITPKIPTYEDFAGMQDSRARTRAMLTALAQFSASAGNIGGKPTETTVPQWMAEQNKADLDFAELARKRQNEAIDQQNKMMDFEIRKEIRKSEQQKTVNEANRIAGINAKATKDLEKSAQADDPNSQESRNARDLVNAYYGKYMREGTSIPETTSAAVLYKLLPGLSNIARGEQMGRFGLLQTGLRGEQALELSNQNAENLRQLEELKKRYDVIKNDNTEASRQEIARIKAESDALIAKMRADNAIQVANIGAKSREKAATITGQYGLKKTDIQEKGKTARVRDKVKVADQYRQYKEVKQAASAYTKDPIVRNYLTIAGQRKKLEANLKNPTAIGDVSSIFGYMKGLDPTSAVRPGEIDLVNQAQSIKERILNIDNRILKGESLTPELRKQIYDDVKQLESLAGDNVRWLNDTVRAVSKEGGWSPDSFLIKFGGEGKGISVGQPQPKQKKVLEWTPGGLK